MGTKPKTHFQYVIVAVFLLVLCVPSIFLLANSFGSFQPTREFYKNGEKVDGIVIDYVRYCGTGNVNLFWVSFIVEYESDDGTKYRLEWYDDNYKYATEQQVADGIGKTRPLIIDGKGNCIKGTYNIDNANKIFAMVIVALVIVSILTLLDLWLLIWAISKIVQKRKVAKAQHG